MRYVSSIPAVSTSARTRQVHALSSVQAIKPVHTPEQVIPYASVITAHQGSTVPLLDDVYKRRDIPVEDRRKLCRRANHQAVLIELRSGIDRRHHNLREGAVVDHIDETA
jgi:hypothetical protein